MSPVPARYALGCLFGVTDVGTSWSSDMRSATDDLGPRTMPAERPETSNWVALYGSPNELAPPRPPRPRSFHARSADVGRALPDADDSGGVRSEPLELREGLCECRENDVDAAEDDAARQCVAAGGGPTPTPMPALGLMGEGAPPDCERPRSTRAIEVDAGSGRDLKRDSSGGDGGWLRRDEHEDHEPWLRPCEPGDGLGGNGNSPALPPREIVRRRPTDECSHGCSSTASVSGVWHVESGDGSVGTYWSSPAAAAKRG